MRGRRRRKRERKNKKHPKSFNQFQSTFLQAKDTHTPLLFLYYHNFESKSRPFTLKPPNYQTTTFFATPYHNHTTTTHTQYTHNTHTLPYFTLPHLTLYNTRTSQHHTISASKRYLHLPRFIQNLSQESLYSIFY